MKLTKEELAALFKLFPQGWGWKFRKLEWGYCGEIHNPNGDFVAAHYVPGDAVKV